MKAMFHDAKFRTLSACRSTPIHNTDLVHGCILEDSPHLFRVGASYAEWMTGHTPSLPEPTTAARSSIAWQTDKHRMVWIIEVAALQQTVQEHQGKTDFHQALFRSGRLHLLTSAPKIEYAKYQMSVEPKSSTFGEHFLVFLHWLGDVIFHHSALLQERTLGSTTRA